MLSTLDLYKPGDLSGPGPKEIPDVRGMLAKNLRFSELNLEINKAYVALAEQFQDIYDPERQRGPSWYGFAPYASRQAGGSIKLAERLTNVLDNLGHAPAQNPRRERELDREFPDPQDRESASIALSLLGPAPTSPEGPHTEGLGDLTYLAIAAKRLRSILARESGPLTDRVARVARTLRNMLEDGNRRIISEIGVAGQDYLQFRQGRSPTPDQVLDGFTVSDTPAQPDQARGIYRVMERAVQGNGPLLTDWDEQFPPDRPLDRSNFIVASFAAYEAARLEPDARIKNRWIEQAGILMAFREQNDIVQAAFEDSASLEEVPRSAVMKMVTPWTKLSTHNFDWSFRRYAAQSLPPADNNPLTPRAAEYSWGDFSTRWGGVLDFFSQVFQDPGTIWPMPSPDPSVPLA